MSLSHPTLCRGERKLREGMDTQGQATGAKEGPVLCRTLGLTLAQGSLCLALPRRRGGGLKGPENLLLPQSPGVPGKGTCDLWGPEGRGLAVPGAPVPLIHSDLNTAGITSREAMHVEVPVCPLGSPHTVTLPLLRPSGTAAPQTVPVASALWRGPRGAMCNADYLWPPLMLSQVSAGEQTSKYHHPNLAFSSHGDISAE